MLTTVLNGSVLKDIPALNLFNFLGILLSIAAQRPNVILKCTAGLSLLLLFTVLSPSKLPVTGRDPNRSPERILKTWETSDCTVVVLENMSGHRTIKINSNYGLGSTGDLKSPDPLSTLE